MDENKMIDVAMSCQEATRSRHTIFSNGKTQEKYLDTMFCTITSENKVVCYFTPHILENAELGNLIHSFEQLAIERFHMRIL